MPKNHVDHEDHENLKTMSFPEDHAMSVYT